jgi:nucleoside-diphosphate-sugar epimerase
VLVRNPQKLQKVMAPLGVELSSLTVHEGDVMDADWGPLLGQYQALVHSAGLFSHDPADADRMWALNVTASDKLLKAAVSAGLDPVIHVSSFMAMFPPLGPTLRADDPIREPDSMYARTKAQGERDARALQAQGAPVVCVYPASVVGPHDPTVGSGPEVLAKYVNDNNVLITQGGLTYTDVRDLGRLIERLLVPGQGPRRVMAPADFISHEDTHRLLCEQTGRTLKAQRLPGWLMRVIGRVGDAWHRLGGAAPALTYEAALVITRCVPSEDAEARRLLGNQLIGGEQSVRDMLDWMMETGIIKR